MMQKQSPRNNQPPSSTNLSHAKGATAQRQDGQIQSFPFFAPVPPLREILPSGVTDGRTNCQDHNPRRLRCRGRGRLAHRGPTLPQDGRRPAGRADRSPHPRQDARRSREGRRRRLRPARSAGASVGSPTTCCRFRNSASTPASKPSVPAARRCSSPKSTTPSSAAKC